VRYATGVEAVRELSLTLAEGGAIALVGASGSGKSTVVRAILGLLPPNTVQSGRIRLGHRELTSASVREMRRMRGTTVGYVAQDPYGACDPVWPVKHHVAEAWYAHRLRPPPGEVARRLAGLKIATMRRIRPYAWSGGMLQRATVAAATAHAPPLIVADEPTSSLDADLADGVLRLLRQQARALLLVTHDLTLAARHCDRLLTLQEGRIVEAARTMPAATTRTPPAPTVGTLPGTLARPEAATMPAAELAGVTLRAGRRRTLARNVDLAVRRGEIVGIVGPSGVGKTTLLHTLAGLRPVGAGTVSFGGRPTPPRGYVMPIFQDAAGSLDPRWPIWCTVAEPLALKSRAAATRHDAMTVRAAASELLARVGLATVDPDSRPGQLSGGQQQRVAIARALAASPALLIADEPLSRLDSTAAAGISTLLRDVADSGTAIVVASHDVTRLASLADRVVRLSSHTLIHVPSDPATS
jgi:peptide/nickel transport system ATP-binding protein